MSKSQAKNKVGELRPSQILFSSGVGSVIDLPNLSTMVMGLDDWDITHVSELGEERLLAAVKKELSYQVKRLLSPPFPLSRIAASPARLMTHLKLVSLLPHFPLGHYVLSVGYLPLCNPGCLT